ncbi:MAG TPA: phosphate propanoyltransferase [bacterium]|jgi:putative phosphotransacetylase|nr:phosphate propanoyltransferase [bacterium]HOG37840.1 phosphate propanoyltransferase [bacterium]HQI03057.1 phosphate propanoyltransferase [bacterium]
MKVKIEYSNRHIHPSRELIEQLYGEGYQLNFLKKLSQADDFAAKETVTIMGPKTSIENVRILGPERKETQIEISKTDAYKLGIEAPIRLSGDIDNTPGIKIINELNEVKIEKGVIIAKRHLHVSPDDAKKFNLKDGQVVKLKFDGERSAILDQIIVRIGDGFQLRVHLDTDEANALGINQNDEGELII